MGNLVFGLAFLVYLSATLALVVAAFRSSVGLGFLTLLVPFYAVSYGNRRLTTAYRKHLAVAWWVGFAGMVLAVMASG